MTAYDAIIVGSGAGGGMYAKVLTEAGARVLLIDAGGHNIDHDIRHHQWPWELPYRNVYQVDKEYAVRLATKEYVVGKGIQDHVTIFDGDAHHTYYNHHFWAMRRDWKYTFPDGKPYRWVRVKALGGKTNCWDAGSARWGPLEFKPASYDGYDVDWPMDYAEMAPWYTKTERLIGVSGGPETRSVHSPTGAWLPPLPPRCGEAKVASAAWDKFRLFAYGEPKAAISRDYRGRPACHYCGPCHWGCDSGSKFTTIGVLLPPALATGRLTIRMNTIVREILVEKDGMARGVSWVDRYTRQEGEAYGRIIVVCASAIETARLMLISKSSLFPDGLANSSGQVGRNLVENIVGSAHGYFPDFQNREVVNNDGWGGGYQIAPFVNVDEKSRSTKFLRRYRLSIRSGFGMGAGGGRGGYLFGEAYKRDVRRWYGSGISVSGQGEGIRNPNNYIDLDPEVKDAWGMPAARVQLTWGENEQKMIEDMTAWGARLIEAAGGVVKGWSASPSIPGQSIHEQGTCRMGNDPKKFVTNPWGQCHDVKNLFIGDGALDPTCAIGDPTLTILAMSMRNASHLAGLVRRKELRL
ncbi:MAG: GMC oxidoreductase [Terriglobia bacterium]